ncbi:MAG: hypothetical protein ACREJ2_02255 [Planctomycetota bacterium]
MFCSLVFDTEDYTSPEHWGMDDIPKWCAEIMSEEGITGTFLVIGNKARSIRDRGRKDVIAAMRKHEIGLHTQFGSDHPTLTESQAPLEWHEAVEAAELREGPGYRELGEIFDTNIGSFSTHGASQSAPMHYVAGAKFDRPWLYSFAAAPANPVCWYDYCFQYGPYGLGIGSEGNYSRPDQIDAVLQRWEGEVEAFHTAGVPWIQIFMAHPLMIRAKQFNDALNYADGKNRIPWVTPEMRTLEEMEVARTQFRRVVRWIAKHPKLTNATLYDTFRKLGLRKAKITRAELAAYATVAHRHESIRTGYSFSPGEALLAMAEGLLAKILPQATQVREVLGPIGETPRMPDNYLTYLGAEDLRKLARGIMSHFHGTGMLPTALPCPNTGVAGGRMGLPTIYHVLCDGWLQTNEQRKDVRVRVPHIVNRYPQYTDEVEARFRRAWLNWPIHSIDMPLENLSRHVRLQCWTCKNLYDGKDKPFYPPGQEPGAVTVRSTPAARNSTASQGSHSGQGSQNGGKRQRRKR